MKKVELKSWFVADIFILYGFGDDPLSDEELEGKFGKWLQNTWVKNRLREYLTLFGT